MSGTISHFLLSGTSHIMSHRRRSMHAKPIEVPCEHTVVQMQSLEPLSVEPTDESVRRPQAATIRQAMHTNVSIQAISDEHQVLSLMRKKDRTCDERRFGEAKDSLKIWKARLHSHKDATKSHAVRERSFVDVAQQRSRFC